MLDQQPNVSVWPVRAQEIPSGLPRSPEGIDSNSEQPHSVSRDHTVMGWSLGRRHAVAEAKDDRRD